MDLEELETIGGELVATCAELRGKFKEWTFGWQLSLSTQGPWQVTFTASHPASRPLEARTSRGLERMVEHATRKV